MEIEKLFNILKWGSFRSESWLNQREGEQGDTVTEKVPQTGLTKDLH